MKPTYPIIRAEMARRGWTYNDMADYIGISPATVATRMQCRQPWTVDEMYKLLKAFNLPVTDMPTVFPEGGKP